MSRRVIVGVGIASYPLHAAGNTWAFLQWVLGFRAAGWEDWIVEDVPLKKCIDAQLQPCATEVSADLDYWSSIITEYGLQDCATLFEHG